MSTTNKVQLTAAQLLSNKAAIQVYIATKLREYGERKGYQDDEMAEKIFGKVILLPEFTLNAAGAWEAMDDSVIRAVNNPNDPTASMMRYATIVLKGGKPTPRYTNEFMTKAQLDILMIMSNLKAGSVVKGKLVVEESLVPFRTTNPARDIKWVDQAAGLACKVDEQVIYSRVVFTQNMSAEDVLITHTNKAELSAAATIRFNGAKANSDTLKEASQRNLNTPVTNAAPAMTEAQIEARVEELEAMATLTRAQKKELAELTALLPA